MSLINAKPRARSTVPTPEAGRQTFFFDAGANGTPTLKNPDGSFVALIGGQPGLNGHDGADGHDGHLLLDYRGAWDTDVAYPQYALVSHQGALYGAQVPSQGQTPGTIPTDTNQELGGNNTQGTLASTAQVTMQAFTVDTPITVLSLVFIAKALLDAGVTLGISDDNGVQIQGGASTAATSPNYPLTVFFDEPALLVPGVTYRAYVNSPDIAVATAAGTPHGFTDQGYVDSLGPLYQDGDNRGLDQSAFFQLYGYPSPAWTYVLPLGGGSGGGGGHVQAPVLMAPDPFGPTSGEPVTWRIAVGNDGELSTLSNSLQGTLYELFHGPVLTSAGGALWQVSVNIDGGLEVDAIDPSTPGSVRATDPVFVAGAGPLIFARGGFDSYRLEVDDDGGLLAVDYDDA